MTPDKPLTLKQQRFVDALPTADSYTDAAIKAGYTQSPGGSASGMASENLKKPQVIAALADRKKALADHAAEAQAHFGEHTVAIAKAMVERAEGKARDSQRAGERILEQVGVLQREPLVVTHDPSQDVLAKLVMLMARELATPEQEAPSIEAEVREVFGKESDAIQE